MLDPLERGFRQHSLDKGIGYIHNGSLAGSIYVDSGHKVCLDIGNTVGKMRLKCTPVFNRQQVHLVQWLRDMVKVQSGKLLDNCS